MLPLLLPLALALAVTPPSADSFPSPIASVSWLAGNLMDPKLVVVQVGRSRAAYDSAHVAGARYLDFGQYTTSRDGIAVELPDPARLAEVLGGLGIDDGSRVVIYGDLLAAARLWFTLDWLGHGSKAAVLDGGLDAWRAAGHSMSTEAPAPKPAKFTAAPDAGRVVDARWIQRSLPAGKPILLDARSAAEFSGEKQEEGVPRSGHIPGAKNLDWTSTVANGRFKPLAELLPLFEQAGLAPGDEVVTYCRTGTRSAVLHLLARALGFQARMYDGSMMDWSRQADLPVETGRD
jgi:thiosulfate/3-mercaptopyruvate sulfurtransferase